MKNIIWLSDGLDDTSQLGGKATSLRTLFRRGLPAPGAFVIAAHVKEMTPELEHEIFTAFGELESTKVAVRSSALNEDGNEDSWAGQFETYLDVEQGGLIEAIKNCWQSVSNDRSQAYASAKGQNVEADIAVVVQSMIPSELSGVIFSRDPRGDDGNDIVIEATKGVGEKLVQGEVDPDEYIVGRQNLGVKSRKLQQEKPLLANDQIKELADYAMRIEMLFGKPQDIEWAIANGKTYILQARPITTLNHIVTESLIPTWKDQLLFRWGPAPASLYYFNGYTDAFSEFIKFEGLTDFPETIVSFRNNEVLWVCEQDKMTAMGKEAFLKLLAHPDKFSKLRLEYDKTVQVKKNFEAKLATTNIYKLDKTSLAELLEQYYQHLLNFWRPTILIELANYGSTEVLNDKLLREIDDEKVRNSSSNVLLLPHDYTYTQREEFELAKSTDLSAHAKKYGWLMNSYTGPQQLGEAFFDKRKAELILDIKSVASRELQEQNKRKAEIIKEYDLSGDVQKTAKVMVESMLWQDERKAQFLQSVTWNGRMLNAASKLIGKSGEKLKSMPVKAVIGLLCDTDTNDYAGYRFLGKETAYLNKAQNDLGWELYSYHNLRQNMDGVQGVVASRGQQLITHGRAVVVLDPKAKIDFPEDSILVAQMTTPDFIFYMRKASAVVTDTGGITSHAAIICRELNVPCVVGTKNATKLFKDGDLLQVNTLHGTALRMKKA